MQFDPKSRVTLKIYISTDTYPFLFLKTSLGNCSYKVNAHVKILRDTFLAIEIVLKSGHTPLKSHKLNRATKSDFEISYLLKYLTFIKYLNLPWPLKSSVIQ